METMQLQGGSKKTGWLVISGKPVLLGVPKGPGVSWRAFKQAWDSFHKLEVLHLRAPAPGCVPGWSLQGHPLGQCASPEGQPSQGFGAQLPTRGATGQPGAASQTQLQGWVSCRTQFWSLAAKPVTRVYGSHCPRGQLQASPPSQGLVKGCWSWKPWQLLIP